MTETTPVRAQYLSIKKKYPDAILFFRLGDFYETFDDDAAIASHELDIVLTSRKVSKTQKVPMAGIPYHAADNYIGRLIEKGYHVAICEQVGDQPQKGLFPREVVRVVTPGTIIEPGLLRSEKNNYLLSYNIMESKTGVAFIDISTGDAGVTEFVDDKGNNRLQSEIGRLGPAEIIFPEGQPCKIQADIHQTAISDWKFEHSRSEQEIIKLYRVSMVDGFGLRGKTAAICALGGLISYLQDTDTIASIQFKTPAFYSIDDFMVLDQSTRRNLELTQTIQGKDDYGSLIWVIDKTVTAMGKRRIIQWINQPLTQIDRIQHRLDAVDIFYNDGLLRMELQSLLKPLADIERIATRINSKHASPRDLASMRTTLEEAPTVFGKLEKQLSKIFPATSQPELCQDELSVLQQSIAEDPPATLQHIGIIKSGYSAALDDVIHASKHARDWIAGLEKKEKATHGIKTLKVGYNKVFGYYIEISKSYLDQVPESYIRKQTLVNAERFITPELKEYESIVLNAEEQIRSLENQIFYEICETLSKSTENFLRLADQIATIDVFLSLAQSASENNYCKPELREDQHLNIKNGRHPVVEKTLSAGEFVPNESLLTGEKMIHIITGPNMSGKSTYLRQVALIALMAQIGSFVPAEAAVIGLVDRIFTRIGAQDEIHAGQSTFMVEMVEAANILNNATNRSLLILDEIGRGTSTYDGLSIAWAMIEFIHNHPKLRSRTLFATHYHELTILPDFLPQVANYNVAVSESENNVVFLHKIISGGSDKSYGIHVAQLAGMPRPVLQRASELLSQFENDGYQQPNRRDTRVSDQLPLFKEVNPLRDALISLDIETISPIEAINILYQWKKEYDD
jgi:DNA mismatch repair protein MutS